MFNQKLAKNIEEKVGLSLKEIKEKSPEELQRHIEKKNGLVVSVKGYAFGKKLITRKEINKQIDVLLRLKTLTKAS